MRSVPDISTLELSQTRLKLRSDLLFIPQQYGDKTFYHVEAKTSSEYYRLGYEEYVFVSLLDGHTNFSEALAIASQTLKENAISQTQAMAVYSWLLDNGLASFSDTDTATLGTTRAARKSGSAKSLWKNVNPLWLKIPLGRPEAALRFLTPAFRWMFSGLAAIPAVLLLIVAGLLLRSHWTQFVAASSSVISRDNWIWLLVAWISLKFFHELGHGVVCMRYGGHIREAGLVFAMFAPLVYVDASASWAFRSRWQRMHTAIAGIYIELVIASIAILAWTQCDSVIVRHLLQNVIIMASVSTLLFNLNPLMRFDGYYVLSDLLQIPNLSRQANVAVKSLMQGVLFGSSGNDPMVIGKQRWILITFGVATFCWRMLMSLTILIAASVLFRGAGIALAAVGLAMWFGQPIWAMCQSAHRLWRQHPERMFRASLVSMLIFAFVTACLLGLPAPVMTTAPGIVDFANGQIVRALTAGFVDEVHVGDGQEVSHGDLLVTLRNDDVESRLCDLLHQISQEELRLQIASHEHDSGAINVAQGNLVSLARQLAECQKQSDGLKLRASRFGRVIGRDLETLHGTFAQAGMELLTIGITNEKEMQISIGQRELAASMALVGQPLRVRIGTHPMLQGILRQVNPGASRSIPHPTLAAANGGPLPVVESDSRDKPISPSERLRLTEHRFTAIVTLPPEDATAFESGERGIVSLGLSNGSLGAYLWRAAHDWIDGQFARLKGQN
jgi:putative peptide zinc metalloprotease protein